MWNGIPVLPRAHASLGMDIVPAHVQHTGTDVVIMLGDLWPLHTFDFSSVRLAPWFVVDCEPLGRDNTEGARRSWFPMVFSRHGERMCQEAGINVAYVPHGIDTKVFSPGDKVQVREKRGLPRDAFIATICAANKGYPCRKAFAEQIEAFAQFKRQHSDALLYLHTLSGSDGAFAGVNLPVLCASMGLRPGRDVLFTDEYLLWMGLAPTVLADIYRASDVLMSVSYGEGFGLPIVEAQACGCPVIIGGWSSMPELCFGGWIVEKNESAPFWLGSGAYHRIPSISAIHDRLCTAYNHADNELIRKRARTGAEQYDADVVAEQYWVPALAAMEAKLTEDREARMVG
jgi:glycosyltransferase involved in cell wall biosynthesis